MPDRSITEIAKYKVISVVGEGAMGVVYRATDPVLNRTVAIKVMSEAIARQQELRDRFLREAQAAGSMQHPNIVSIYDLGETEGHLYIAMEFVEGLDLETIIADRKPLALQAKLDIIIDVLSGLAYAHKRGITHRDIKPANIRITEDGRAKIMDFGIAHLNSSTLTQTGMVVGTPAYMSPEQVVGSRAGPATDLFAVGAVLYEVVTGVKAFEGPTIQSLFFKIVNEPPLPIETVLPGLPVELGRVVHKALKKNPVERYQSALEMANDLAQVRAKLSGAPHPGTISLTATVASAMAEKQRVGTRARQWKLGGMMLGAVAFAALFLFVLLRNRNNPVETPPSVEAKRPAAAADSAIQSNPIVAAPSETQPVGQSTASQEATTPSRVSRNAELSRRENTGSRQKSTPQISSRERKVEPSSRPEQSPRRVATRVQPTAAPPATSNVIIPRTIEPPPPPPVVQAPAPSPAPAPGPPPATPPRQAAPPAPTAESVHDVVAEYAQAIESRDISAVRRVYTGLTSEQQNNLEAFFKAARGIKVTFRVTALEVNGTSAEARLVGTYNYVGSDGRAKVNPVSVDAQFKHNGTAWRLVSVGQ
ncbi:MAG: serine/threonine-protein kinase [Gemmatimonadaceae bacterium]